MGDEDGFGYVVGRIKEIIPTHRGFNIAPRDIEEVLYQHEAVGQAAVVGVPHPCGTGDMVVAWATAKNGTEASAFTSESLKRHCEAAGMPEWQLPDLFQVSATQLPIVGGKIDKKILQAPGFMIDRLAAGIEHALEAPKRSGDWVDLARDVFERLDGNRDGILDLTELRVVFHEKAECMLRLFRLHDGHDEAVNLGGWLMGIGKMQEGERVPWLMQAGSILAAFERKALTGGA